MHIHSVEKADLQPLEMPDRFRMEVVYFMTPGGDEGVPNLAENEYWIRLSDSRKLLEEFVVEVISPLDAESKAEFELTEEQESWLEWLVEHEIEHIRLVF
jgi:hypothetical protein